MPIADLADWLADYSKPGTVWYVKRLAANDTLASKAHQAGPYIPKEFLFRVLQQLHKPDEKNPEVLLDAYIDSHTDHRQVRAVWYNNKNFGGTRNETRITNWGGQTSALLDPDSTGALALFAFPKQQPGQPVEVHIWVCNDAVEEDFLEERISPVQPGEHLIWEPAAGHLDLTIARGPPTCRLTAAAMPQEWTKAFPTASDIVRKSVALRPLPGSDVDARLVERRDCEYQIFRSVEEIIAGPRIAGGFGNIDEFVAFAQTVLQRRKARAGLSLELQAREIFTEEGFVDGKTFSFKPESEPNKEPDFLFPSEAAYKNQAFPSESLRMLAAKTTCRDRWRQVVSEADRIKTKHLLTLQEGVSENQFAEMTGLGVRLVVPAKLKEAYPEAVQPHLISFQDFVAEIRLLAATNR